MEQTLVSGVQPSTVAEEQFESFFRETYPRVFRAALLVSHDHGEAEDATATAYMRAWGNWSRLSKHPAPLAWVTRVAINESVSLWRRFRRRLSTGHAADDRPAPDVSDPDLAAAISALPLRQRQVLALRLLVGLDVTETAAALGIANGTVTTHLHRALETCRLQLEGIDPHHEGTRHDG